MSTPPDQPVQHSSAGGVNSNLPPADDPGPTGEMYPDPATHTEDPRWTDTVPASNPTTGAPPPVIGQTPPPPPYYPPTEGQPPASY
jgi:hypothetical protein